MKIDYNIIDLKLNKVFRISHSTFDRLQHLVITVEKGETVAYGEVITLPFWDYGFERTLDHVKKIIKNYSKEIERIKTEQDISDFIMKLNEAKISANVICGFEMLLFDFLSKEQSKNLFDFLGYPQKEKIQLSNTLTIQDCYDKDIFDSFSSSIVKIKLGGEQDLELLKMIQSYEGDETFYLDMNQGWSFEKVQKNVDLLNNKSIALIEEPFKIENMDDIKKIKGLGIDPYIIFDESISSYKDCEKYIEYIDGINIKLFKVGGYNMAKPLIDLVKSKNKKLMLGCFIETNISIAYASYFSHLFDFIDLDGSTFLSNDPFTGIHFKDGEIVLNPHGKGLGVGYVK